MFPPNFPFELLYSASYSTFFSTKYLVLMNSTITMVPIKYVKINWIILELRGQDCKVQNFWEVHIFFQKSRNSFWTRRVSSVKVPAFLRGPKKIATSFLWFWHLISKHQNHKENGANFCVFTETLNFKICIFFQICVAFSEYLNFSHKIEKIL